MSSRCLYNIIKDIIIKAIGSAGMLILWKERLVAYVKPFTGANS